MAEIRFDIKQDLNDRILAVMEQGKIPWSKDWLCLGNNWAFNRITNKTAKEIQPYSLMNQFYLAAQREDKPWRGEWASFEQWKNEGYMVKKGEKGSKNIFWKPILREVKDKDGKPIMSENGKPRTEVIPVLKYSTVFHISQVQDKDGNPAEPIRKLDESVKTEIRPTEAEDCLNAYLERFKIALHFGGDQAFYAPGSDSITLPEKSQFKSTEAFLSTFAHESVHSTGHKDRLNRLTKNAHFGSESYSKEELTAEIGSMWFLNLYGVETAHTFENSVAYLQGWMAAIKDDKNLIVTALGRAEKAVKLILNKEDKVDE